jgi:hypothetical protein
MRQENNSWRIFLLIEKLPFKNNPLNNAKQENQLF